MKLTNLGNDWHRQTTLNFDIVWHGTDVSGWINVKGKTENEIRQIIGSE